MPILKPISGHTGCRNVRKYLEKNGRAIARDFFNLSWDEREMRSYDQAGKEAIEWDREMDRMRASFGNDAPCKGRKARTYKHFVISPDPEDDIDIESLRGIASDWALRFFGDHQIAIVYHDDNTNGIPHAHVVVNNTNLKTGNRMRTRNPLELNRALQDMARKRGLSGLFRPIQLEKIRWLWYAFAVYMTKTQHAFCKHCGKPFMKSRPDKQYCNDKCRKAANR